MEIHKLDLELVKNGKLYKQLKRNETSAIYECYSKIDKEYILTSYEVFQIGIRKPTLLNGYEYPEAEIFPSNESFGRNAWSFGRRYKEKALMIFDSLNKPKEETIETFKDYKLKFFKNKIVVYDSTGAVSLKQKLILAAYYMSKFNLTFEDIKPLTTKQIIERIYDGLQNRL